MRIICKRLRRGEDLLLAIRRLAEEEGLAAAVVLSGVGCVSRARLRCADGVRAVEVAEPCEIVSLTGTVSAARTHLHLALAREDLGVVGGHLLEGCVVNTTCELVLQELEGWRFGAAADPETGYDEIVMERE